MWEKHWFSFAELALPHYYFLSFGYSWAQVQLQGDTHFPRQVSYQILPLLATVFVREYFLVDLEKLIEIVQADVKNTV